MKALSLWQPWASLIATGVKKYETRSWATSYRGPLLICSAKRPITLEPEFYPEDGLIKGALYYAGIESVGALPLGKALCMVDMVACFRTEYMTPEQIGTDEPFGDFSPGRFAWKLENVRAIKEPFPIKGRQGLFEVEHKEMPR